MASLTIKFGRGAIVLPGAELMPSILNVSTNFFSLPPQSFASRWPPIIPLAISAYSNGMFIDWTVLTTSQSSVKFTRTLSTHIRYWYVPARFFLSRVLPCSSQHFWRCFHTSANCTITQQSFNQQDHRICWLYNNRQSMCIGCYCGFRLWCTLSQSYGGGSCIASPTDMANNRVACGVVR